MRDAGPETNLHVRRPLTPNSSGFAAVGNSVLMTAVHAQNVQKIKRCGQLRHPQNCPVSPSCENFPPLTNSSMLQDARLSCGGRCLHGVRLACGQMGRQNVDPFDVCSWMLQLQTHSSNAGNDCHERGSHPAPTFKDEPESHT